MVEGQAGDADHLLPSLVPLAGEKLLQRVGVARQRQRRAAAQQRIDVVDVVGLMPAGVAVDIRYERDVVHQNDQPVFRHMRQVVGQPFHLPVGHPAVVDRPLAVDAGIAAARPVVLLAAGIDDVVQHHEMDLADIEREVVRTVQPAPAIGRVFVRRGVEVEVVVAVDVVLRQPGGAHYVQEARQQVEIVAHDIADQDHALEVFKIVCQQVVDDAVADIAHLGVRIGLGVAHHHAAELIGDLAAHHREVDGVGQRTGGLQTAVAKLTRRAVGLVMIEELRHQIVVHRHVVFGRFGDEDGHVVEGRQLVAAIGIRQHDLAAVRDHDARNARLVVLADAVPAQIFEDHAGHRVRGGAFGAGDHVNRRDVIGAGGIGGRHHGDQRHRSAAGQRDPLDQTQRHSLRPSVYR